MTSRLSESRRRLAAKHWPMALGVASWFAHRYPNVPADWEGAAADGLCRAAARYRKGAGASWRSYAWAGARMACRAALRVERARGIVGIQRPPVAVRLVSLDTWGTTDNWPLAGWASCTADRHDDQAAAEAAMDVAVFLRRLRPRESRVLCERFGLDGGGRRNLDEIARGIGRTKERVRQIACKGLARLRSAT